MCSDVFTALSAIDTLPSCGSSNQRAEITKNPLLQNLLFKIRAISSTKKVNFMENFEMRYTYARGHRILLETIRSGTSRVTGKLKPQYTYEKTNRILRL